MDVGSAPRQSAANTFSSSSSSSSAAQAPSRTAAAAPPATRGQPGAARGTAFKHVLLGMLARANREAPAKAPAAPSHEAAPATTHAARRKDEPVEGGAEHAKEEATTDDDAKAARAPAVADSDLLDPSLRHAAQLAPPAPIAVAAREAATNEPVMRARSLEELLPALVKKIAWAGDRHAGTVRMELGAGAYAGTTVVVHADGGKVRVELAGLEGAELDRLRARLDARLRHHGIDVESVT